MDLVIDDSSHSQIENENIDRDLSSIPSRYKNLEYTTEYVERINHAQGVDGNSAALRIGSRIREIRKAFGLSQVELGERIGLTGDRIQKYENGARKPNPEQIHGIAAGLGVNSKILVDPIISDPIAAMFALFEMELFYGLKIFQQDGKIILSFDDCLSERMKGYLKEWASVYSAYVEEYENASSELEADMVTDSYNKWKYSFHGALATCKSKADEQQLLEKQIEALQQRLKRLKEE